MADVNNYVLYEAFSQFLKMAQGHEERKNYQQAATYYKKAAEKLLEMAQKSKGAQKEAQFQRAMTLVEHANSLSANPVQKGDGAQGTPSGGAAPVEKISVEEALARLDALEGLSAVKTQIRDWVGTVNTFNERKARGLKVPDMSFHMVFTGNPGTGKTTVARIIAQIYCALGIVSNGHLVEVSREDLVAGYVGQTAPKTSEVVARAIGGVLFIDEAYTLNSNDDFCKEAVATLMRLMENNRDNLVVIAAGYKEPMKDFLRINAGLTSRFKNIIHFDDYNAEQLSNIFYMMCEKNGYLVESRARAALASYFRKMYCTRGRDFANGRDVRNLFETLISNQSRRTGINSANLSDTDLMTFYYDDLPPYVIEAYLQELENPNIFMITPSMPERPSAPRRPDVPKTPEAPKPDSPKREKTPEEDVLGGGGAESGEFVFNWDKLPKTRFEDVAGLEEVKRDVKMKVILPITNPEKFEGYDRKNGGGLLLYGPPGTGKTMIASAIANEIGAKFCAVTPSELLHQGVGQSEKAVRALFAQARKFPIAVIYFDEMDSLCPKSTKSQYSKNLRSELLSQLQGMDSYGEDTGNILYLIAATNKPWEVDSAFMRPGRFGTKIYVGLPDSTARRYLIEKKLDKIRKKGVVAIAEDVDVDYLVEETNGYNGSDVNAFMEAAQEISIERSIEDDVKIITADDFEEAFKKVPSSVMRDDIVKLSAWRQENGLD